jgi:carbon monoxide dehydrogenase subunit G
MVAHTIGPAPRPEDAMEISGSHTFDAPRERLWALLLDPKAIERAIPGCERMVETGPDAYDMTVKVGIAAIKGTYSGTVAVKDVQPQDSYRLAVSGSGKPGSVHGDALLRLSEAGGKTTVSYTSEVKAQGAIARLGNRLLGGAARLMIGQFMNGMEKQL